MMRPNPRTDHRPLSPADVERLDELLGQEGEKRLRALIRDAIGLRDAMPGSPEIRGLLRRAVEQVNSEQLFDVTQRSVAASNRPPRTGR
jgi:hypothetical protein